MYCQNTQFEKLIYYFYLFFELIKIVIKNSKYKKFFLKICNLSMIQYSFNYGNTSAF